MCYGVGMWQMLHSANKFLEKICTFTVNDFVRQTLLCYRDILICRFSCRGLSDHTRTVPVLRHVRRCRAYSHVYLEHFMWVERCSLFPTCELRHPPEDTHLMNLVLIESMDKFIHDECKANCEACQVNSDSQFDHCK